MTVATMALMCLLAGPVSRPAGSAQDFLQFDRDTALQMLGSIENSLASFRDLTSAILDAAGLDHMGQIVETTPYVSIHPSLLASVGNTWWEEQNIGFVNWPNYLRGFIEAQQLRILVLERRVAVLEGEGAAVIETLDRGIEAQAAVVEDLAGACMVD